MVKKKRHSRNARGSAKATAVPRTAASMRTLLLAVEQTQNMIIVTDLDGSITYVNPAFERAYGYSREEVLGKNPRILKSGRQDDAFYRDFWRAVTTTGRFRGEIVNQTKDGRLITIETTLNAVTDSGGRPIGYIAVQNDITKQRRAERAAIAGEQRIRLLLENAKDAILISDGSGVLLEVNRAAEALHGLPRAALIGRPVLDFVAPEERENVMRTITTTIAKGSVAGFETLALRADGSLVPVEVAGARVDFAGQPLIYASVRDVSERRHLQEQLFQSQKMEAVGRLAGGVAHDFNNMLMVITSYAELLRMRLAPGTPEHSRLDEITKAADRASALTRHLLTFSRTQAFEPKVLDLNALVEGLRPMLSPLLGESVRLAFALEPRLGSVRVDPAQIEQVVMNLAVNARDAMPEGGTLTIATYNVELAADSVFVRQGAPPGPQTLLSVSDTGSGMTAEVRAHIFEPFFTTKAKGKGTGLGLSTVYGVVRQSNGHISVYSEPGRGTTFNIYLPRADGRTAEAQTRGDAGRPLRGREAILVVDDEPSVGAAAAEILGSYGYAVETADSAEKALATLAERTAPVQLLLTDVVMPGTGGAELAAAVRSARPRTKVLFMSGHPEDVARAERLLAAGAGFIQKPFSPEALAKKVRQLLDERP